MSWLYKRFKENFQNYIAERFHQGCSISDTARKVAAYRIRQENPRLSLAQANQLALERANNQ